LLDEAVTAYGALLTIAPNNPQALMMLGIIFLDKEQTDQAWEMFDRLLRLQPDNPMALHNMGRLRQNQGNDQSAIEMFAHASREKPDFPPIYNDWAVSLNRLGMRDKALTLLDKAISIDPEYAVAHDNRGLVLFDLRRFADSAQAHFVALAKTPLSATSERMDCLLHLAYAALEAGEVEAAERACRAILAMDMDHADAINHLAKVLDRMLRDDEARALRNRLARTQGLVKAGNPDTARATILLLGGVGAGHVPTRYLFDPAVFLTRSLSMLSPDQQDAPLGDIPFAALEDCDVVFNSLGEVEKQGGQGENLHSLCTRLNKPVLNPADRVAKTGRDNVHQLFGSIPGLVVPKVSWVTRQDLLTLETATPVLVRPGGAHGGKDLALIDRPHAAGEYLKNVPYERFLLTDFHDFKGSRDSYRKYRFIFVDRKPYAYHLAIADSWLVHYWRAEMGVSEWKRQEEELFLTHWTQVFGPKAVQAVEQIGRYLDLDYGGMDCSLLPTGEVLLFEANACMLLHLDENQAEFPYKHKAVPLIREAITQMVLKRL
jgi:tetratricopeptide (TPR) repeat protein